MFNPSYRGVGEHAPNSIQCTFSSLPFYYETFLVIQLEFFSELAIAVNLTISCSSLGVTESKKLTIRILVQKSLFQIILILIDLIK